MDSNQDYENNDRPVANFDDENSISIEDFIRQLEARERDLEIDSDMAIEIGESDFDDTNPQDFIRAEVKAPQTIAIEPIRPANPTFNDRTFSDLEDEITELRAKLEKADSDRHELATTMRRRQFDFDSYRKRTERERGDTFLTQLCSLASRMLPVIDNMDRALSFADQHSDGRSSDFHEFFRGIVLVSQQLNEVLAEMGIVPIAAIGEPFDPNFHEAVAAEPRSDVPHNTVVAEVLRGYRVDDKVIRAAMVRVAVAPPPEPEPVPIEKPETNGEPDESNQ
jgi:molecular chaperone GrpE